MLKTYLICIDKTMSESKNKTEFLQVRMRSDVKRQLELLSESNGLTMSAMVQFLVIQAAIEKEKTDPNFSRFVQNEKLENEGIGIAKESLQKIKSKLNEISEKQKVS